MALAFALVQRLIFGVLRAPAVGASRALSGVLVTRCGSLDVVDLRHEVLRPGRPREDALWTGDDAPETRHWAARQADRVVGVVTVMASPPPGGEGPCWQLRGMAVAESLRGAGVGGVLLAEVQREVGEPMWCNARERAVPFYARHGWVVVGERFEVAGVGPHFQMRWAP